MVRGVASKRVLPQRRKILLVEPGYKSKYPPLGLMKIASYHRSFGDEVQFVRGCDASASCRFWDRIYISTLFTYDWRITRETIRFYKDNLFGSVNKILVGGIAASLLPDKLFKETGIYPITGCLSERGVLDDNSDLIVDEMVPDYSILDQVEHKYVHSDAYIGYATRGCVRRCPFCAVPKLEPHFVQHIPLTPWVTSVRERYGEKKDLILLDNNVLASRELSAICDEILDLGFAAGSKFGKRSRFVDFNQGLDARLLTVTKMRHLARIPVKPFRLACDSISFRDTYERAVRIAADKGVRVFATYLLYNWQDRPEDLWERIHQNVKLGDQLGVRIWSFPMRYIPVSDTMRGHIGPHWNRRFLRSIQCILLVNRGIVSARHDFFHRAFGATHSEFLEILSMPEHYIINRVKYENDGAADWRVLYRRLTPRERAELWQYTSLPSREKIQAACAGVSGSRLRRLLGKYVSRE